MLWISHDDIHGRCGQWYDAFSWLILLLMASWLPSDIPDQMACRLGGSGVLQSLLYNRKLMKECSKYKIANLTSCRHAYYCVIRRRIVFTYLIIPCIHCASIAIVYLMSALLFESEIDEI